MGFRFRNEVEEGPGGKRMRLLDPDGNPVHLVERRRVYGESERAQVPVGYGGEDGSASVVASQARF
jgi:hypothetical protein